MTLGLENAARIVTIGLSGASIMVIVGVWLHGSCVRSSNGPSALVRHVQGVTRMLDMWSRKVDRNMERCRFDVVVSTVRSGEWE